MTPRWRTSCLNDFEKLHSNHPHGRRIWFCKSQDKWCPLSAELNRLVYKPLLANLWGQKNLLLSADWQSADLRCLLRYKWVDWLWSAVSFSSSCNETFSFSNFEECLEMQRFYLTLFIPFHSVAFSEGRKPFVRFSLRGKRLLHWTWEKLLYSCSYGSVCVFLYIRSHSDNFWSGYPYRVLCNYLYPAIYIFIPLWSYTIHFHDFKKLFLQSFIFLMILLSQV